MTEKRPLAERSCIEDLPENHLGAAAKRSGLTPLSVNKEAPKEAMFCFLRAIRVEPRKYSSLAAMQGIFYVKIPPVDLYQI